MRGQDSVIITNPNLGTITIIIKRTIEASLGESVIKFDRFKDVSEFSWQTVGA